MDFVSALAYAGWPAIPTARGAQLLTIQFQLEYSQWLSPAEIGMAQGKQLTRVVEQAGAKVPFYRDRLAELKWDPQQPIEPSVWQAVPVLSRSDLQTAGDSLLAPASDAERAKHAYATSSGSTGSPVRTLGTTLTRLMWHALTLRQHLWHRRDLNQKFATIRWSGSDSGQIGQTQFSDAWGASTAGIVHTGPAVGLDIQTPIDQQAEWLLDQQPAYLLTYPSNLRELTQHFIDHQLSIANLREVQTFGETLDADLRSLCRRAWDVPLVDNYSAQEVGYIALQCPVSEKYHVQSESLLVEVIDDLGKPCRPGEIGRVVVSTLQNFGMPLLRYEIGDYAEVGESCPCGRGLPVLNRIAGRSRNMFRLPDGRLIWPSLSMETGEVPEAAIFIRQYQIIQRTLDRLHVRLVTSRLPSPEQQKELANWVRTSLGYPFQIDFELVDRIDRGSGGKFEDFRSEVGP